MGQDDSFQEKTESATPKRRQKVREEGNSAKSVDLNSAVILFTGILVLYFAGNWMFEGLVQLVRYTFENAHLMDLSINGVRKITVEFSKHAALILVPLMITIVMVGIFINLMQVGLVITLKPIAPKFNRLNPISGVKRLFSLKSIMELVKSLLKLVIIGSIAYKTVKEVIALYHTKLPVNEWGVITPVAGMVFLLILKISLILIVFGIFDYMYQKYEFEKSIRMTKEEVKAEAKEVEGDPKIKSRIRSIQIEMARKRMMENVPTADLVITNPIHLAVALKYKAEAMIAPKVVAKGARLIAEKIKKIAVASGIPIVENKPLAQALYYSTEVGMEIPENLFKAVAEILAYVYKLKGKKVVHG